MRVDGYNEIIKICQDMSNELNLYFIARIQSRKDLAVHVNNGNIEEITTGNLEGLGIQVFNSQGYMGFAASDQISTKIAIDLFKKATFLAQQSQRFQAEHTLEFKKLTSLKDRIEVKTELAAESLSLNQIETKMKEVNQEVIAIDSRLSVRSLFRLTDEEWRVFRADGTDVIFNTPRSLLFHSITAKEDNRTASAYANLPGIDLTVLTAQDNLARLQKRAAKAARLALDLLSAPKIQGGNYKLVIDYALAKGLAHEAFGHAVETDGLESSILGDAGRLKTGIMVAGSKLSIIDGPIEGDYAYQPISAVGIKRRTVRIVDHGQLMGGLADIYSASKAGVSITGAERVESFFHLPIARMSNIRIEYEDPIPVTQDFESITAAQLYYILNQNNLIKPGETVLYLTGFQGGQVNPAFGDFVFHCSGIYQLAEEPVLYQPAIFSGKILSVLKSVSAAIGPPQIDAIGTCGKMGQSVPSCGGSHYFLVIDSNPEAIIGGV